MPFNIPIKVDPGDSPQKLKGVGDDLAKAEQKSDALTRTLNRLSRNFDGVGQAIKREQVMLKSIHGDWERFRTDVTTLDSLLRRNMITLDQHRAALARSRSAAGIGNPLDAVSLPGVAAKAGGVGSSIVGAVSSFAGPAALGALALRGINDALDEMARRRKDLTDATVIMLKYKDSIDGARESAEGFRSTSRLLGTDMKTVAGTFESLSAATSHLAISERKLTEITRDLGIIMKADVKPIESVGQVLSTLEFAMEKGNLSHAELQRLMKNYRPLAQTWAESFSMTEKQLLESAKAGKINTEQIAQMLTSIKAGPDVLARYQRQLEAVRGEGMMWTEEQVKAHVALKELNKVIEDSGRPLGAYAQRIEDINASLNKLLFTSEAIDEKLRKADVKFWTDSFNAANEKMLRNFTRALDDHNKRLAEAKRLQEAWNKEVERISKLEPRLRNMARAMTDVDLAATAAAIPLTGIPLQGAFAGHFSPDDNIDRLEFDIEQANNALSAFDKNWAALSDNMEQGVLQQVSRLGDELADLFMTGEFGWRKMIDAMIRDMTRLAIQQAVMFGFKSAFPSFAGSAGLDVVPRFASGGAGHVDTDSMFVGLRMTPNERLIVQTPGQQMRDREQVASAPQAAPSQPVQLVLDERALLKALNSPMGATVLDNVLRRNPGLLRGR